MADIFAKKFVDLNNLDRFWGKVKDYITETGTNISGQLSDYVKTSDFEEWVDGDYTEAISELMGLIGAKLDSSVAANTYATKTALNELSSTVSTKANASALDSYLTKTSASSTYATKTALDSYLTTSSASNTYLTKTSASSTYATKTALNETSSVAKAAKDAIDAFMDTNAVSSGAVDTLNEVIALINAGGSTVQGLLGDITNLKNNKLDASDFVEWVDGDYTEAVSELMGLIGAKLDSSVAANTYATKTALDSYLTTTNASNTYLTKTSASNTYATKTALNELSSTVSTKADASALNSYLTKTSASNTYLTKTDASNTYLTKTDASNTYLTKTDASNNYATKAYTQEYATTLFNGIGNYTDAEIDSIFS